MRGEGVRGELMGVIHTYAPLTYMYMYMYMYLAHTHTHWQHIYEMAGQKKHWRTVRYAASLLKKVVDCLAPSVTAMLVRGKEVHVHVYAVK